MKRKHPHSRGEDARLFRILQRRPETPPLTWGRLARGLVAIVSIRNTPTHVGKTTTYGLSVHHIEKHPHSRGEDTV